MAHLRSKTLCLLSLLLAAPLFSQVSDSEQTSPVVPLRGIYHTAGELAAARKAVDSQPWRAELRDWNIERADRWLRRDDDWIRSILPPPGSIFAYGMSGCPACGAQWKRFGGNTCSLDRQGKVVCPKCDRTFPDPDPASPYHDTGKGVTINGKTYYLVGVWNSYVIQQMYAAFDEAGCALSVLAHAYALTGREEYAHKAIVIMDALATLSPTTNGPRDFDSQGNLESDWGRLHFLSSIVYRALTTLARDYDLVGHHPLLQEDSPTSPGITMAENIRLGLFEDYLFRHFDVRGGKLANLHNHEADSVRAMLVVGLLFGNPDYIRWGIDGFEQLLVNTVDRDGMYYETSTGYTQFTRGVFSDMAELIANYSPGKYSDLPGQFPPEKNFFDDPRLIGLAVDNFDLSIAGHHMNFGNDHIDRSVVTRPVAEWAPWDWTNLARFVVYSTNEEVKRKARHMLKVHVYGRMDKAEQNRWWLLKMADPLPQPSAEPEELSPVGPAKFFSTKNIAAFQSGEWPNRRGFLVRGGPNLPHAQDDLLGLNFWDVGRELAAELGYGTFGSHMHRGWGTRAIAHNLVTIDADEPLIGAEYFKKSPGASFRSFYDGGSVKFMDADGAVQFRNRLPVERYRRRVAMVDVDSSHSYYLDVFDVDGGSSRDYSLHAPYNDKLLTDALTLENLEVAPVEGAWTLAGLSAEWRNASWNAPGRSWGERVTAGEYLRKVEPDDGVGPYNWAPPGRGYGFLYNLRARETAEPWSATWAFEGDDEAHLRATFLPTQSMLACTANAPDLSGKHLFNYVVCRDSGTSTSRFIVLLEPYRQKRAVKTATLVDTETTGPVVVRVELADGRIDHLVLNEPGSAAVELAQNGQADLRTDGEFAFVRSDPAGKPLEAHLVRGKSVEAAGGKLITQSPALVGKVEAITPDGSAVRVRLAESANDTELAEANVAVFSSPHYNHTTVLQVRPETTTGTRGVVNVPVGSAWLQKLRVEAFEDDGYTSSSIPAPLVYIHETPTHFLNGKALVDAQGKVAARIRNFRNFGSFSCLPGAQLEIGQTLNVADFVPGDRVEFPLGGRWRKEEYKKGY